MLIFFEIKNQESRIKAQEDRASQNLEASLSLAVSGSQKDSQKLAELSELRTTHINLQLRS